MQIARATKEMDAVERKNTNAIEMPTIQYKTLKEKRNARDIFAYLSILYGWPVAN